MRSFQQRLADFDARGIRVAALSTDSMADTKRNCRKLGFTFTVLSDPKAEVIGRYDLLHKGGGPEGIDIARPAEFLLDASGIVRWVKLTDNAMVRARPEEVLKAFDELKAKP